MIQKKLEELESLITVPDVNKEPEQSINAMKMLNLIVELRGLVKNCNIPVVINCVNCEHGKRENYKIYCKGCISYSNHSKRCL